MEYKILDKTNIQEYLYSIENIKNYFENDDLIIDEIGDGNLNYVYINTTTCSTDSKLYYLEVQQKNYGKKPCII